MNTRTRTLIVTNALLAGLIVAGCSSATSHTAALKSDTAPAVVDDAVPGTEAATTTVSTTPGAPNSPTTTAGHSSKSGPGSQAPTTAPVMSIAPPKVTVAPHVTINPALIGMLVPEVTSVAGKTSFTCVDAALAGYLTSISWKTTNAASVKVSVNGPAAFATGLAVNGHIAIPIPCGSTEVVKVTALWADGTAGLSKTITIKVSIT